ncbi:MAG: IgGFc-binding protein [Flavobacteriales bacterium]|nr:IgGFc-binding protein [Flavobacteriales bacterium]
MKKRTAQLAVILGLLFSSFSCFSQLEFQSEGTRFWIGYIENITLMFNGEPRFSLRVSSDIATTGTIIVPTTNLEIPFEIEAGATEIDLPDAIWYSELSQVVDNKGILIETATPVELAAIHYRIFFTDGAKILPESSLGTDYMALAVEDLYGVSPSTIVIVETEDDTEIEVTPSVLTEALFPADVPFTFTMNAGQSYQIHANGDLSGSTISSLTGQKIAVYAGAQQAAVGCAPDDSHHWEQIIPTAFWGTEYALIPYRDQSENIFKILAGEDNTNIFIDCELEVTLNAGETYEILTSDPLVISSDLPVQVGQLNRGSECNPNEQGPSFAILHPLNHQSTGQSLNFTGGINGLELVSHYVNLVCLESTASEVLLDGNEVNFAPLPQNPNLVYARVSLNQGNHEFVAP